MQPEEQFQRLKGLLAEIADLYFAMALLNWDQQTYMPPGGAENRGYQLATLQQIAHTKFVSDEIGQLLEDLQPYVAQLGPDSFEARLVKVTRHDYEQETKLPLDFVTERALVTTAAYAAWGKARAENDFPALQPHLEKIFGLAQRFAGFFAPYEHPYDPLLDIYEPGMKTKDIKAIFDNLRPQQVELIRRISSRPQVDDAFLHLDYDEQKQWDVGVEFITQMWPQNRRRPADRCGDWASASCGG